MGFPVDSRYEARQSGATVVKSAWANAVDDALNGAVGGSKTVTRIDVDGLGYQSGGGASGSIMVRSGQIIAGGNIQTSGGIVLGVKLASTGVSPGLELRSGTTVFAQHYAGRGLVSGAVTANLIAIPVTSGQAITAIARGVGQAQSGSVHHVQMFAAVHGVHVSGSFNPVASLATDLMAPTCIPSGYLTSTGITAPTATSGTVIVSVLGAASRVIDYTVYVDVTYTSAP